MHTEQVVTAVITSTSHMTTTAGAEYSTPFQEVCLNVTKAVSDKSMANFILKQEKLRVAL